jgi:hypothetical protein
LAESARALIDEMRFLDVRIVQKKALIIHPLRWLVPYTAIAAIVLKVRIGGAEAERLRFLFAKS